MLMFECPKCHKCFFMEDGNISVTSIERSCPNCGNPVPSRIFQWAQSIRSIPEREESGGWDVCHLPDKHFKVQVSVTSIPELHEQH